MQTDTSRNKILGQNQKGQIALEYVLILLVCIGVAVIMRTSLVSRNPDNPGIIMGQWKSMLEAIGQDTVDAP